MNILTTKEFELKVKGWKIYSKGGINMSPYTSVLVIVVAAKLTSITI